MPLLATSAGDSVVLLLIDGQPAPLDESHLIPVHSARLNKTVHHAASANPSVAKEATASALRAFSTWKKTTHTHRRDLLLRVADIYERRIDELVRFQCDETSCQETWARFNVVLAVKTLRETAASITAACTGEMPPLETPGAFCLVY